MYIGGLLLLLIIFIFWIKVPPKLALDTYYVKKDYLFFNFLLILIVILCSSVSVLFFSTGLRGYFTTFSPDSLRYAHEIDMFVTDLLSVNELNGSFDTYKVTPKMGLPSLIAWIVSPFGNIGKISYYVINNMTVLCMLLFANSLLFKIRELFNITLLKFFLIFGVMFIFPLDFYWLFRFLREPGANIIFLIVLLLSILHMLFPKKRYVFYYCFFSLLLLFYRPQLLILSTAFCFIINLFAQKNVNILVTNFLIGLLAFLQTIATMGIGGLSTVFDQLGLTFFSVLLRFIEEIDKSLLIAIIVLWISFSTLFTRKVEGINTGFITRRIFYISIIFLGLGLLAFITQSYMQIRFVYPFIYFGKITLLTFFIRKQLKNTR